MTDPTKPNATLEAIATITALTVKIDRAIAEGLVKTLRIEAATYPPGFERDSSTNAAMAVSTFLAYQAIVERIHAAEVALEAKHGRHLL
jgi:hypothetical protein